MVRSDSLSATEIGVLLSNTTNLNLETFEFRGDVTICQVTPDEQLKKFKSLNGIDITRVLQRDLKYKLDDLKKFVISVPAPDVDYDWFSTPQKTGWWANGIDRQESFSDSFSLFAGKEEILQALITTCPPPANSSRVNVHSLHQVNGDIVIKYEYCLIPRLHVVKGNPSHIEYIVPENY